MSDPKNGLADWALIGDNWVASLSCSVVYEGSAVGVLNRGDFILFKKRDGSVSIHGGSLNQPRNYLRSTKIEVDDKVIIFSNKKERLIIHVECLHWKNGAGTWSENLVQIYRSERQLVEKFCTNIKTLLPEAYMGDVQLEYQIPGNGRVDIGIFKENKTWLIEVKRKKATQVNVGQVIKYRDHYSDTHQPNLVLAAPDISDNGLVYAEKNGIQFIPLEWDPLPVDIQKLIDLKSSKS